MSSLPDPQRRARTAVLALLRVRLSEAEREIALLAAALEQPQTATRAERLRWERAVETERAILLRRLLEHLR